MSYQLNSNSMPVQGSIGLQMYFLVGDDTEHAEQHINHWCFFKYKGSIMCLGVIGIGLSDMYDAAYRLRISRGTTSFLEQN